MRFATIPRDYCCRRRHRTAAAARGTLAPSHSDCRLSLRERELQLFAERRSTNATSHVDRQYYRWLPQWDPPCRSAEISVRRRPSRSIDVSHTLKIRPLRGGGTRNKERGSEERTSDFLRWLWRDEYRVFASCVSRLFGVKTGLLTSQLFAGDVRRPSTIAGLPSHLPRTSCYQPATEPCSQFIAIRNYPAKQLRRSLPKYRDRWAGVV